MVDAVGVGDDGAAGGLAEDLRQPADRHHARVDDVPQDAAGTHGGKLVHVADEDQGGIGRDGPDELVGQHQVHHAGLVDDEHVAFQRVARRCA